MALAAGSRKWLRRRFQDDVRFDEPMSRHTTLRIGGPAEAFVAPAALKDLQDLVKWCGETGIPLLVVGAGSNLLVKDDGVAGIVAVLTRCLNRITETGRSGDGVTLKAMAGVRLQRLCAFALSAGLKGLNFALGIPGTVGGAIMMNAGTSRGRMQDVVQAVTILTPEARLRTLAKEELIFAYRRLSFGNEAGTPRAPNPVIVDGRFRLQPADGSALREEADRILQKRRATQPTRLPSAGCFFKNPPSGKPAGELLELAGLKGERIGGALVSRRHANFIVNSGGASAADMLALMEAARAAVLNKFNVELEPEVQIVGR